VIQTLFLISVLESRKLDWLRAALELAKVIRDFGTGPLHGANEFAADYTAAINDVGFRPAEGAVQIAGLLGFVADGYHVHAIVFEKLVVGSIVGVDADGEHRDAFALQQRLHAHQRRCFGYTRRAPRRPEVQHYDLAAEPAERDGVVGILQGEVGSVRANAGRVIAAVASGEESNQGSQQSNRGDGKERSSHTVIIAKNRCTLHSRLRCASL